MPAFYCMEITNLKNKQSSYNSQHYFGLMDQKNNPDAKLWC